jgi:helix-turn-helix protein
MAYEVVSWKEGCVAISFEIKKVSLRENSSKEVFQLSGGEGGALNASHPAVEAVAKVSNLLGTRGFEYNQDFIFKICSDEKVIFDFSNLEIAEKAERIVREIYRTQLPLKLSC